ncbi:MAG: dehydrogenase subunit [Bacillales bacterium]|nr:dehydrogenase subunit [Bacillales bacterium]
MADEKNIGELKKEAAAKAKAAALAKLNREKEQKDKNTVQKSSTSGPVVKINANVRKSQEIKTKIDDVENKKDFAKEKATTTVKANPTVQQTKGSAKEYKDEEKEKAIALAKEKVAAAAKAKGTSSSVAGITNEISDKKIEVSSVNQPLLDLIKKEVGNNLGSNIIEELYINKLSKDIPTLIVNKNNFYKLAKVLKENKNLDFDYFNHLHGTDFQTHMEVYIQIRSYKNGYDLALKTKLNREYPEVDSLTSLWEGASWPESEAFDLLGIKFNGNPDLHRIFLGESWVGHPLRKDYQPYEEEVVSE